MPCYRSIWICYRSFLGCYWAFFGGRAYFARRSIRHRNALLPAAIRALCRPISLSLNTGSVSPYFAIAQYGLCIALFRYRSIRALAPAMCSFHCAHTPTQPGYCPLGNTPCPFLGWLRRQSDRSKVFVEFMHISHKYIHFVTNVLKYARFERCHRSFSLDVQGYT